jgi:hypothetical protein
MASVCKSASNTAPCADCRYAHDVASKFVVSAGSSSAPIVIPPDFHFVSLSLGVALPWGGVKASAPIHIHIAYSSRVGPNRPKPSL